MRYFLILLFSLLELTAFSQKITGSFQVDLSGYYTKSQVDSLVKASGGVIKPPVVIPPVVIPPVNVENNACIFGPELTGITSVSNQGLSFQFNGLGVDTISYDVYSLGALRKTGVAAPKSSSIAIVYPSLSNGTYVLKIRGKSCKSGDSERTFEVKSDQGGIIPVPEPDKPSPVITTGKRRIYLNGTSAGFDVVDLTGIAPGIRSMIESFIRLKGPDGKTYSGIDGIRLRTKWYDYEPTPGVYRDDILLNIIKYCKERNLILCIAIVGWRAEGDGMFDDADKARLSDGQIWTDTPGLPVFPRAYIPSFHSAKAQERIRMMAEHLSSVLKKHQPYTDYVALATAQTEEYQLIRRENPLMVTGFSDVDRDEWKRYSGGKSMPNFLNTSDRNTQVRFGTDLNRVAQEQMEQYMSTDEGRQWYLFQTEGLRKYHAAFVQGVKKGGARACAMYAGIGAASAVANYSFKLNTIFSAGTADQPDLLYSSEGDPGSNWSKLAATDVNIATFKGAAVAIEFDHPDISQSQAWDPDKHNPISGDLFFGYASSALRRGAEVIHLAMHWEDDVIQSFSDPMWKLRKYYITTSDGMVPMEQGSPFSYTVDRFTGDQGYRYEWGTRGGSETKQVLITLK